VKLGILSTAEINRKLIPGAREAADVELVAVASRSQAAADAYAREWEIPTAHGSYESLLADPEVDAVYISLPNSLHVERSVRALDAGKHVLCEKPLDRSPAEVERAFDAADRAGRILMEAFMYRHNPQTRRLQELVRENAVGALSQVEAGFGFHLDDSENVRLKRELRGGSLMDVGCYCVSGSRLLAGEAVRVEGRQVLGGDGVDVHFEGTLYFAGDVVARIECGFDMDPPVDRLEVLGGAGAIVLTDPWHAREPVIEIELPVDRRTIRIEPRDSYQLQLENLAAAIRGDAEPLLGRADALGQARTIDALYRSAESGEPVTL
jgi:xylose dehydrogenase (NAD/NADP)